jgi:chloramphenicol 3-O phosphotransferase
VAAAGPGRAILLNGASSSGKTSIGRALQEVLDGPWYFFPVDALGAMRSDIHTGSQSEIDATLRRMRKGYHRAVAALASVGNNVIMDYPLSAAWRLDDLLDVLATIRVTLVDVYCAPDELDRRERGRGDRPAGLARSQRVFGHDDRDITVDTTSMSAHVCASAVAAQVAALGPDTAFDRLRRRRADGFDGP